MQHFIQNVASLFLFLIIPLFARFIHISNQIRQEIRNTLLYNKKQQETVWFAAVLSLLKQ